LANSKTLLEAWVNDFEQAKHALETVKLNQSCIYCIFHILGFDALPKRKQRKLGAN
jgi:hypothetical protein